MSWDLSPPLVKLGTVLVILNVTVKYQPARFFYTDDLNGFTLYDLDSAGNSWMCGDPNFISCVCNLKTSPRRSETVCFGFCRHLW